MDYKKSMITVLVIFLKEYFFKKDFTKEIGKYDAKDYVDPK